MANQSSMLWLIVVQILRHASAAPWPGSSWGSWAATQPTESYSWPATSPTWATTSPTPAVSTYVNSAASPSTTVSASLSSQNLACATVSSFVATDTAAVPTIPASIAWDCLQSVPLNAADAVPWLESLKPYINWQSTLAYLKHPPSGYLEPAVDVYGELDAMISNIDAYAGEYDLEFALYELFQRTHDGHFRYLPTLMAGVLTFGRPLSVVSVSSDGQELPKPYVYSDILLSLNDTLFQPSAITTIDGDDVLSYLEMVSQYGSLQDPDALYNNVMFNLAQLSLGATGSGPGTFQGSGRGRYVYPGPETILTFENGSSSTFENFARVMQNFSGINTGEDVYTQYLFAPPPLPPQSTSTSTPAPTPTPAPGYPQPVIRQINNLIAGYYLSDPQYADIAVLSIPSFVGVSTAEQSFAQVGFDFIAQSKTDGKTKLLIDVSANGGGTITQAYNLFKNLFPDIDPYDGQRFRAHETVDLMGQVVSEAAGPVYPWNTTDPPGPDEILNDFEGTPFNYRADMDVNAQPFTSWAEKYGPHEYYGDEFSSIFRWNLSDPFTTLSGGIVVNGYGNRTGISPSRPYEPEDIVILYDGYCASTCTIFSELMVQQAGIKSIAIGGRPLEEQMQAVGGVKGRNDYDWQYIFGLVNDTLHLAMPEQLPMLENSVLSSYSQLPFERSYDSDGYVNFRDGIRRGDTTQTPLQFVYEPADCRIWYEPSHVVEVETMWERAADVAWYGGKCVVGDVGLSKRNDAEQRHQKNRLRGRSVDAETLEALRDAIGMTTFAGRGRGAW